MSVKADVTIHVRGYMEECTVTTSFDMAVLNNLDRIHLVMDVIDQRVEQRRQEQYPRPDF